MKTLSKLLYVAVIAGIGFSSCEKSLTEPKLKNANDDVVGTLNSPTNPNDVVGTFNNNDDVVGTLAIATDHNDVVATLDGSNSTKSASPNASTHVGTVINYDNITRIGFIQDFGSISSVEFVNDKNLNIVVGDCYRYLELYKNTPGEGERIIRVIISRAAGKH